MSQQSNASWEDDHPLAQPVPTESVPMAPQNQLQSSQQVSKDPRETQSPVYLQSRTDIQTRGCTEPYNQNKRASDVQGTPQFTESGSVNSEAECTTPSANEMRILSAEL